MAGRLAEMITEVLKKASHFRHLSEEELDQLARAFVELRLDAGATVYETGTPVEALFVVVRGMVLVFRGPRGEGHPVARLCSGDLLGTADLFDRERHSETACAMDECVVLRGDKGRLLSFLEEQPNVALNLRLAAARDLTERAKMVLEAEKREAVRHRVNRKVRVQPADDGAVRLTLLDLSRFGMSLRGAPASWQPDVVVDYLLEWGDRRLHLSGCVAWREGDSVGINLRNPSRELQSELEQMLEAMLRSRL